MSRAALRTADLIVKDGMHWAEAEKLALEEIGIGEGEIDELIGNAIPSAILALLDKEDVRDFVRSILVNQPDDATESQALLAVAEERKRQDAKWGGAGADDKWSALDWHEMIADYNGWARRMACMASFDKARNRYLQVAALAVAAAEAMGRREAIATQIASANGGVIK